MNTEWVCSWKLIPIGVKQTKAFPSQAAARAAMAKVLTDAVDLKEYIDTLRNEEGDDCGSSADFLEKFLSDLTLPSTEDDVPPHLDVPDHCNLAIYPYEELRWEYARKEVPYLFAGYVYEGTDNEPYVISFNYESPKSISRDRVNAVEIRIVKHQNYGPAANPLMVLFALNKEPATQKQLARRILETWETDIERKAIGRHLQLLQDLGYPVHHGADGYYRCGDRTCPNPNIHYGPSAYPFLILEALDRTPKTQTAIIREIQEKYGVKIDRKAVVRNLALLKAFGYNLQQKGKEGYYLGK